MLPAVFAVFGDLVTAGLVVGCTLGFKPNQIERRWPVGRRQAVRDLFPHADLPWYQSATGEGLLRYGFSVDRGYFGGYHRVGRVGGCVRLWADRPIWQDGKARRAADRAGAAGPAGPRDPGRAQLGNGLASAG